MSFSAAKAVATVSKNVFSKRRQTLASCALVRSFLHVQKQSQMTRTFTRSMWHLSSSTINGSGGSGSGIHLCQATDSLGPVVTRLRWPSVSQTCSCGHQARLHTEGDREFSQFLGQEIALEKEGLNDAGEKVDGFVLSTDGADTTLTKTKDGETVSVKFNVNHSVEAEPAMGEHGEIDEQAAPEMRSYPEFTVQISKDGSSILAIKCHFSEADINEDGEVEDPAEENRDYFIIDEVSIHKGSPDDSTYVVGSEVMDGTLYDMLMRMMSERGVDNELIEKVSDLASTVEHTHYVKFLEGLKHIVDC